MTPRALRAVVATALAAVATGTAVPATAYTPPRHVYVVTADGIPTETTGLVGGRTYTITVSGAYTYDAGGNFADCGHYDAENPYQVEPGKPWTPYAALRLDGAPAACSSLPYSDTHTYTWSHVAAGGRVSLSIVDGGSYDDNAGALVVTIVEDLTAAQHRLEAECLLPAAANVPNTGVSRAVVAGYAHALIEPIGVGISLTCSARPASGGEYPLTQTAAGPAVVLAGLLPISPWQQVEVCTSAVAVFSDADVVSYGPHCE